MCFKLYCTILLLCITYITQGQKVEIIEASNIEKNIQEAKQAIVKSNYDLAIEHGISAYNAAKNAPSNDRMLAKIYQILGFVFQVKRSFAESETYYLAALERCKKLSSDSINNIQYQVQASLVFQYREKFPDKAISYFRTIPKKFHNFYLYNNVMLAFAQKAEADSVIHYAQASLTILKKTNTSNRYTFTIYHNLGVAYQQKKNYPKAIYYYQQSITGLKSLRLDMTQVFFYNYVKLGQVHLSQNKLGLANRYFDSVLVNKRQKAPLLHLQSVNGKITVYQRLNSNQSNVKFLPLFYKSDSLVQVVNLRIISYRDKLEFAAANSHLYEFAFTFCIQRWQQTQQKAHLSRAFYFMERKKAQILWQELYKNIALREIKTPTQAQNLGQQWLNSLAKIQRSMLDKNLSNQKKSSLREEFIQFFQKQRINEPKLTLQNLQKKWKGLTSIQNKLRSNNVAIIEYFEALGKLYGLSITSQKITFKYLGIARDIYKSANAVKRDIQNEEPNALLYSAHAYQAYKALFKPFRASIAQKKQLVIIPEKQLLRLPFSALVSVAKPATSFSKCKFLLRNYAITYNYSANLWASAKKPSVDNASKNFLLVMAPTFGNYADSLINSKKEATNISKIYPSKFGKVTLLMDNKASLSNFFRYNKQQYKIIHLTTHAAVDLNHPELCYVEFWRDSSSPIPGKLFLNDIYQMSPKSDLIILNCCESGYGKPHLTEGLLGLSRGFIQIGIPYVIHNIWVFPDNKKTAELMIEFHKRVAQSGSTTNYALALQ